MRGFWQSKWSLDEIEDDIEVSKACRMFSANPQGPIFVIRDWTAKGVSNCPLLSPGKEDFVQPGKTPEVQKYISELKKEEVKNPSKQKLY